MRQFAYVVRPAFDSAFMGTGGELAAELYPSKVGPMSGEA